MAKALYGFMGEPRAAMLLKQVADLKKQVEELQRSLEAAEAEVIALRAIASEKMESVRLEEARAMA
ncbi:MAG: hypothetical protein LC663_05225 [Actinobacteria bacterium]|nr:hypothetical protein [Actinomycetota bacterium]